jgi:hypothetical protein
MGRRREPSGPEILHPFHYTTGEGDGIERARIRRTTANIIAQSSEAITRSLALLERLEVKREAEEGGKRMGGPPFD